MMQTGACLEPVQHLCRCTCAAASMNMSLCASFSQRGARLPCSPSCLLQDPVLFSGTLRSNLDPWDQHNDAALWRVLSAVQLKSAIRSAGGLSVRMAEAGENLSVGQRQLFCLARWAWEVGGLLHVACVGVARRCRVPGERSSRPCCVWWWLGSFDTFQLLFLCTAGRCCRRRVCWPLTRRPPTLTGRPTPSSKAACGSLRAGRPVGMPGACCSSLRTGVCVCDMMRSCLGGPFFSEICQPAGRPRSVACLQFCYHPLL